MYMYLYIYMLYIYMQCLFVSIRMYTHNSIYVHTYENNERCNVNVDRFLLSPGPSVVWVFRYFLIFWIGFSFEFSQFAKTIRICFFGKMLAMFDLAWIRLPGSNVKHDRKSFLCLKFLSLWIWFCMCVALVCRCWLWACWDVAKHNE